MIFKSLVNSGHHGNSRDLERHEEPEKRVSDLSLRRPEEVVDDLNPTEDGEASEKAHCASYQAQLGFHCHLQIIPKISILMCNCLKPSHPSQSHHKLLCQSGHTLPPVVHAPAR